MNGEVARYWAKLCAEMEERGTPMPAIDWLIAASAIAHNLVLVTRNEKDFENAGVHVLNPWESV